MDFSCWPARSTGSWEGTQPGQLIQTGQRDIPHHMVSCSVHKLGELARDQRSLLRDRLGISQRVVTALCITCFVCITIISSLAFLLNCLYLNSSVLVFFFFFIFFILLPNPVRGREESKQLRGSSCQLGLNHDMAVRLNYLPTPNKPEIKHRTNSKSCECIKVIKNYF